METDGPAEGLLIDHEDENEGECDAEDKAGDVGEDADEPCLDEDESSDLSGGRAEILQQAELAPAVEDDGHERSCDAHDGHHDGYGFERVRDGEGLVEDADGLVA